MHCSFDMTPVRQDHAATKLTALQQQSPQDVEFIPHDVVCLVDEQVRRWMAEQRAASFKTRSIKASAKLAGLKLALSMVDLTTLEGKDSPEKVRGLCQKAVRPDPTRDDIPSVAAVCVYPTMIGVARL